MKKTKKLTIHMLGEFYMETKDGHFPREVKKSTQLIILIAYLLMHRKAPVPKAELIDVLWPNDVSDNPEGALRNLIYRARKELSILFPDGDVQCILSKGNMYAWNNQVEFDLDIVRLEDLCKRIEKEQEAATITKLCDKVLKEHSQDFMREFRNEGWVILQKNYYSQLILKTIDNAADKFIKAEDYNRVIAICDKMDFLHLLNSDLHEKKLYSYYKLNQVSMALSYYHKVMDIYYGRFGIEVSEGVQNIYEQLMEKSMGNASDASGLMKQLSEKTIDYGTFYCDFEVFKNVYRVNARAAKRNIDVGFLVLMVMKNTSKSTSEADVMKHTELLGDIIRTNLRQNDVYSRCSPMKYTLMVDVLDGEGCKIAMKRIVDLFDKKKKISTLHITCDFEKIV